MDHRTDGGAAMRGVDDLYRAMAFGDDVDGAEISAALAACGTSRRQFDRGYRAFVNGGRSRITPIVGARSSARASVLSIDLRTVFDRIVVLNLRRRLDRLMEFQRQLSDLPGGWPHRPVEVVRAVDGASGSVPTPSWFRQGGGAYGCWRSHLNVLETALMDGVSSLYILEDDALFRPDYLTRMQGFLNAVPADWEALFPGGQHHEQPQQISAQVVRCRNVQRTHCYALRGRDTIHHLYRMWMEWPVQNPYQDFHCDWLIGPWAGLKKTYAPDLFFVGQARSQSDINGRLNEFRAWNPPDPSAPILWLRDCSQETLTRLIPHGCHPGYDRDERGCDRGLNDAFAKPVGSPEVVQRLKRWRHELQFEVESMLGRTAVVTLWHPESARHESAIHAAFSTVPLLLADADGEKEALSVWQNHRERVDPQNPKLHHVPRFSCA